jgi:type II secretory ATPase GspE/PulE/Tfp pilus assembly ATPase PilB-like protein
MAGVNEGGAVAEADVRPLVDGLLRQALGAGASDIHLEPTGTAMEIRFRVDGVLRTVETLPADLGHAAVLRLMVMAELLTYRLDIPQEGRIRFAAPPQGRELDLRLAILPTAHGLRAAVRLPAELTQPRELEALGLPEEALAGLEQFARADAGMLLVTGPAGAGKTTTIYALLAHLVKVNPGMSIISLEDPVERLIPGVTQVEITPQGGAGQMTHERALKAVLRQDPQVLMLGEVRDAGTASLAVQAALSGHRLIATLHAADPAGAAARLLEMGLEPYQLTSTLFGVLSQRLLRRRAPDGAGYKGRVPVAEFGRVDETAAAAILRRADAAELRRVFGARAGYQTLRAAAQGLVDRGVTDAAEVARVLGDRA